MLLSLVGYSFSAAVRVQEAYATGRSSPSSIMWDKTAPILCGDASQANTNCLELS